MTQLSKLKTATTLHDVAALLDFKASALAYILYKKDATTKYTTFEIQKRHGGVRKISAPSADLKLLQKRLSDLLLNCMDEINAEKKLEDRIAHGFKRGRSIITNAHGHRNRRFVFNVDLSDFFGSINFGRVRGFFINDKNFQLHKNIATILAQIACHENALPQGSPCSPVISNLIGHILDIHLTRLASKNGCTYSRYADDLTFSTNKPDFPTSIAQQSTTTNTHDWIPGKRLIHLIGLSGFQLNPIKTRMQYRDSRQEVTGLVVNEKINVRREYRHTVRAMVHHLFTKGCFHFAHKSTDENGVSVVNIEAGNNDQLHGMLGFIDGIDQYNKNLSGKPNDTKDHSLTTKESIYRRFLLYKEFFSTSCPILICEGKTDNVYLLHAIRSLAAAYPQLADIEADGSVKLKIRIYKYSDTSTGRILGMRGGTPGLSHFIRLYGREVKKFKAPGAQQPVILLVDNDAGAKEKGKIYNTIKDVGKIIVTGHEKYIPVLSNLYVVPTPLTPGNSQSAIEDFFDDAIKATLIGGKSFNQKNEFDTDVHYGKHVFAQKVVQPNANKIDFTGFNSILKNIVDVIDFHSKSVALEQS